MIRNNILCIYVFKILFPRMQIRKGIGDKITLVKNKTVNSSLQLWLENPSESEASVLWKCVGNETL